MQPKTSDDTKRRPGGANFELAMVILVAIIGWSKKFIGIFSNDGPFVGSTGGGSDDGWRITRGPCLCSAPLVTFCTGTWRGKEDDQSAGEAGGIWTFNIDKV